MSEQTPVYTTPGCPLWVDTTNSSFNVDDPTFWMPMSVISGLASGFCERVAVAKIASAGGTVETGAKATLVTGKTWTIGATTDPALGSNNAIVSNVAHGFATGTTGATLYNTHDASFQTVGTSAGANYMKAVDDAITSMVTMQSSYVDANGAAYSFTTLANAAVTRAAASGSSIQTPVKDGTNSNAPFAPAYPVEWAKERKWMLDELRYTGGVTTSQYSIIDVAAPHSTTAAGATKYTTVAECATAIVGSNGTANTVAGSSGLYYALSNGRTDDHMIGRTMWMCMSGSYNNGNLTQWVGRGNIALEPVGGYTSNAIVRATGNLTLTPQASMPAGAAKVQVVFEQGSVEKATTTINWGNTTGADRGIIVSDGVTHNVTTTEAPNVALYDVMSGGSLTIAAGANVSAVFVHSGGYVSAANNTIVSDCVVATGGTACGLFNTVRLNVSGMYPVYSASFTKATQTTFEVITGTTVYEMPCVDQASLVPTKFFWIKPGGHLTVTPDTTDYGDAQMTGMIFVESTGILDVVGNPNNVQGGISNARLGCDVYAMPGSTVSFGPDFAMGYDLGAQYPAKLFAYGNSKIKLDMTGNYGTDGTSRYEFSRSTDITISINNNTQPTGGFVVWHFGVSDMNETALGDRVHILNGTSTVSVASTRLFKHSYIYSFSDMGITTTETTPEAITSGVNLISLTAGSLTPFTGTTTIVTQEPPKNSIIVGTEDTMLAFRCCIESIDVISETGGLEDHYKDFRVRQYDSYDQSETPQT